MSNRTAFTLIELLIVVAIIGILAAIAVPNFLQAQTRAKLARVQGEFQSIRTALESYRVDNNMYPHDGWRGFQRRPSGWIGLTTPVSYINSGSLHDPFKAKYVIPGDQDPGTTLSLYELSTGNHNPASFNEMPLDDWMLNSIGPDSAYDQQGLGGLAGDDTQSAMSYPFAVRVLRYDVSNGLTSQGDIYAFMGGQPAREVQIVDDKPWRR
ncbi:MAG: type II secretion system protein [Candidatus Omnitrophota bacterium]|jgi:type II secretion system protein G|nr:MAG: type II secretion system protein [Candidatus Omnitrophota bacterium]